MLQANPKVSISLLRRNYGMPYGEAARLLKRMDDAGAVSKPDVAGNRDLLNADCPQCGYTWGSCMCD